MRGGNPKKIGELLKQALKELQPPTEPKFLNITYTIPSLGMEFTVGVN